MRVYTLFLTIVLAAFSFIRESRSDQVLTAEKVAKAPVVDGKSNDPAWSRAKAIVTHDKQAGIDITLKAVYTDKRIFFLVSFPDPDESREHKCWTWDKKMKMYRQGLTREDVFVIKCNLLPVPVDLSIYSDSPYEADIWFWKACRTDPAGYADDKIQRLSPEKLPKSRPVKSKSGKTMYLQRLMDGGKAPYKTTFYTEYKGDNLPHFEPQIPSESHADIRAKGVWKNGRWTVEFGRDLITGNKDDIQFDTAAKYRFGVSRYEMAGRPPEPESTQPLYGTGDISENLTLIFSGRKSGK